MDTILHICKHDDWIAAREAGEYRADSLASEGFIHCSRQDQILTVATNYYPGQGDLVLLMLDPTKLTHEVRRDTVGDDKFPHVYGPFNLDAVISVSKFPPDADGVFRTIPSSLKFVR